MAKVNLLDCTLRDGGYINDWNFGEDAIWDMTEKLASTGVDILELGFLKDEPYIADRTVFNSMDQVKELIGKKKPGLRYAVMAEVVNPIPLDMIDPADEDSADIIRVIVWKTKHLKDGTEVDALQDGYKYCKGIVDKGYKLCVQPARVDQYSDEEFLRMVDMFQALDPLAIYVVDSWGTQNAEQLLHYMHLADGAMKPGICLGYHGHNNMMQALSVAQAMLKEGFDRELIIDASVYGIGRGAGNLNLEIIAKYMNEHWGKSYDIAPMLDVYDRYIKAISVWEQWGYSVPFYLTAKYNCNPNYARFYIKRGLPDELIAQCLQKLTDEERIIYSEKAARKAQRRLKPKLAVIVPTANRANAVDNWLFQAAFNLLRYNIDVIIYDSSDDAETEAVTRNFQFDGADNVHYYRYEGEFDGFSLDQKVMSAYREFGGQYEYLWVIRDGLIVSSDVLYWHLFPILAKRPDMLVVEATWRDEKHKKVHVSYTDPVKLFKEQCNQMTILGGNIVKGSLILKILDEIPLKQNYTYSLWQPMAYYHYFAGKRIHVEYTVDDCFFYNTSSQPTSFWFKNTMKQWCELWYEVVMSLPSCYDKYKEEVLKIQMSDFYPFSIQRLLNIRAAGGITLDAVRKNEDKLEKISTTPIKMVYFIASLPKWFARYVIKHKNGLPARAMQKIYTVFKDVMEREKA